MKLENNVSRSFQGSILSKIIFLIYINFLLNNLKSIANLSAYEASLFIIVNNKDESINDLAVNLHDTSRWSYKWKTLLHPDPCRPDHEAAFSRKCTRFDQPDIYFNNVKVKKETQNKTFLECFWVTEVFKLQWTFALINFEGTKKFCLIILGFVKSELFKKYYPSSQA